MDLNELSIKVAEWMTKRKGLFVFSSNPSDRWLYKSLIDHILTHVNCNTFTGTYKSDLSHLGNGSIRDSIFIDDLVEMKYSWAANDDTYNDYQLYRRIVENIREKTVRQNNAQIIFTPLYESFGSNNTSTPSNTSLVGGSSIIHSADFIGIIHKGHLSMSKIRWGAEGDFSDIDLKILFRDQRIDMILK